MNVKNLFNAKKRVVKKDKMEKTPAVFPDKSNQELPEGFTVLSDESKPEERNSFTNLPVKKINSIAQTILRDMENYDDSSNPSDAYNIQGELNKLITRFLSQEEHPGDAADFHNLAVDMARNDHFDLACQVIDCGLKYYPKEVDLLADYLQYGIKCGKSAECQKHYGTLVKIPNRRWTWRGFSFLVDYLQYLLDRSDTDEEMTNGEREMLEVVKNFRKRFSYSEESYVTEADVYRQLNEHDKELETLREAVNKLKVAPKCALRCADILFERGEYQEARDCIQTGIDSATQTQLSVNDGYVHYLSALCSYAIIQEKGMKDADKEAVEDIYSEFNSALRLFASPQKSYSDVIRSKTNTLISKTHVDIDTRFDYLLDLVNQ